MDKMQKELLDNIIDSLDKASKPQFDYGYLREWSAWATRMQDTIRSLLPILRSISKNLEVKEKTE